MDELVKQMQKQTLESGSSLTRLIDSQMPEMLGSQKRSKEYVILSDPVSWSLNNSNQNKPGSTSTINISNKGILDLKNSYIEFTVTLANARIFNPSSLWEVTSFQIGSNMQVQLPYHQPLQECLQFRREREDISRSGTAFDNIFSKVSEIADVNALGMTHTKYQIPFSDLTLQFQALQHAFVSLGQPLQIQMRLRQLNQCLVSTGANPDYTVTSGRLILSYVEIDQASLDKVIRSKIQCLLPTHQVIPVALKSVMNMSFSVNRKDFIHYLVITTQGQQSNAAAQVGDTLAVNTHVSGVIKPRLPIRRLTIILGQQQIVLLNSGIVGAQGHFGDVNLCDLPFSFQYYNMQQLFSPFIVDLTRFGALFDAWGSQVETQTALVQIELEQTSTLPSPYTGLFGQADNYGTVQCFGYLLTSNQISIENGMYKRD